MTFSDDPFPGWRIVCYSNKIEHHTMVEMSTILIEKDDNFFYIYDERFKIEDVSRMPHYIKEDWINYNKKEANLKVIDVLISIYNKQTNDDLFEELVSELKSIRRHLQIKKII